MSKFIVVMKTQEVLTDDRFLVDEVLSQRSPKSYKQLYDMCFGRVFAICIRYEKNHRVAQELACDILAVVFEKLPTFRFQSLLSTWVAAIAMNHCLQYLRKKSRSAVFAVLESDIDISDSGADEESLDELFGLLLSAVELLSPSDREVYKLRFVDGLGLKAIADLLGKNECAVKMQVKRIKSRLLKSASTAL